MPRFTLKIIEIASIVTLLGACTDEPGSDPQAFQPIPNIATHGGGSHLSECAETKIKGAADLENNLDLASICMDYYDQGDGTIEFQFFKETDDGSGSIRIAIPQTEPGHVWDYKTSEVLEQFKDRDDRCDMLLSNSKYPLVIIEGIGKQSSKSVATTDCPAEHEFSVRVSALAVAQDAGQLWSYDIDARFRSAEITDEIYIRGSFSMEKR